ncbi:MAG: (d)CMP kinase [Deltaproteobacteria bacterium]|nr:(d)CMP kinase [Deltaproteobacteria bacterium]
MGKGAIITIDGPAGAGKSTVGRRLAQSLHYLYLDSGSLYRAVAWQAGRLGLDLSDSAALAAFLPGFRPELRADGTGFHLLIDNHEVREEIRTPEVSRGSSLVAKLPVVRQWVTEHLRWLARNGGVVADGRDQGTAVFPEAEFKFYLDAALRTRARRRLNDWQKNDHPPTLEVVMRELAARDLQDKTREAAPLQIPDGATVIDTTDLTVDEVSSLCLTHIRGPRQGNRNK